MNMIETQASGLNRLFAELTPPPVEHCQVCAFGLPDVPQMIAAARDKAKHLSRLEEMIGIETFISQSSRIERKHIINMLIDRASALGDSVSELEDVAAQLTSEIEAQDAIDNPPLCVTCNGSGEGMYDGLTCRDCRGLGVERIRA